MKIHTNTGPSSYCEYITKRYERVAGVGYNCEGDIRHSRQRLKAQHVD